MHLKVQCANLFVRLKSLLEWNKTRLFGFIWWFLTGFLGFFFFVKWMLNPHSLGMFMFGVGYWLLCFCVTDLIYFVWALFVSTSFLVCYIGMGMKYYPHFLIFLLCSILVHWIYWFTKLIKDVSVEQFQWRLLSKRIKWFKACQMSNNQTVDVGFFEEFQKNPFSLDFKMVPFWWLNKYGNRNNSFSGEKKNHFSDKTTPLDFANLCFCSEAFICCLELSFQSGDFKELLEKWFSVNHWFSEQTSQKVLPDQFYWNSCDWMTPNMFEKMMQIFPTISKQKILKTLKSKTLQVKFPGYFANLYFKPDLNKIESEKIILNFLEKNLLTYLDLENFLKHVEQENLIKLNFLKTVFSAAPIQENKENEFDIFLKVLLEKKQLDEKLQKIDSKTISVKKGRL